MCRIKILNVVLLYLMIACNERDFMVHILPELMTSLLLVIYCHEQYNKKVSIDHEIYADT